MTATGRAAAMVSAAALLALPAIAPSLTRSYPEAPPVAHTGGFGEPTCHACHFDSEPDPPDGSLAIETLPNTFRSGKTYPLTIMLTRPGMAIAGFQLAVRFAEGEHAGAQAGSLAATDARSEITPAGSPTIAYLHHTRTGTALTSIDTARWTFLWTAPTAGTVVFHLSANAANDDASPFSDHIYNLVSEVRIP